MRLRRWNLQTRVDYHSYEWYILFMRKTEDLTEQQIRILAVFRSRVREGFPPPTYRELCAEFGWRSTGTARDHIKALVRKGLIDPAAGKARGTQLRSRNSGTFPLPLVGRVVAGKPVPSEQHVDEEVAVPSFLAPPGVAFLLRVNGDSMEGAGILDGDLVVVRQTPEPKEGEIAAVTVDGETTLKRLVRKGRLWMLVPANPRYRAVEVGTGEAVVHGVVTGLLRSLDGRGPVG
jgi:repressor LexA